MEYSTPGSASPGSQNTPRGSANNSPVMRPTSHDTEVADMPGVASSSSSTFSTSSRFKNARQRLNRLMSRLPSFSSDARDGFRNGFVNINGSVASGWGASSSSSSSTPMVKKRDREDTASTPPAAPTTKTPKRVPTSPSITSSALSRFSWTESEHRRTLSSKLFYSPQRVIGETESGIAFIDDVPQGTDFVSILPTEISFTIFALLDPLDLDNCALVSHDWNRAINSDPLWRQMFYQNGWSAVAEPLTCWKYLYRTRQLLAQQWGTTKHAQTHTLVGHQDSVYCCQFDNDKIVTGSRDKTIRVWNASTYVCERVLAGHEASVLCLQFDDTIMVSGSSDYSIIVWDMISMVPIRRVMTHTSRVLSVCLSPEYIFSCSKDGTICVTKRSDFTLKYRLSGHNGPVNNIQVFGDYIYSAGGDALIKKWSLASGLCVRDYRGHTRGAACIEANDRLIVSGSSDNTIRVWDKVSGTSKVLEGHSKLVRSINLFDDYIISSSYDLSIKIWTIEGRLLTSLTGYHSGSLITAKADRRKIVSTSLGCSPVIFDFGCGLNEEHLAQITG